MPLTESVTIPLQGEQAAVFASFDQREAEAVRVASEPIRAERNAHVSSILAGQGLLKAIQETPGVQLAVDAGGVHVSVQPPPAAE